ncbi:hypothetical protein [Leifsonia sp. fls2-241-R2A-40a]|uniref:hypothetical protein n=1 Tax=Leifsonia sp. fls2-241-R2A-40a TaxID=3040290 RepID=UPI002551B9CE|nr:hypothetical protein [Leifsonia sp. fls2-241-R2A-40a]
MSDLRGAWKALGTGALAAAAVVAALLPGTGTHALWNGVATTDAGTVTAATVSVTEAIAPPLDVVFRSGRTTTTGGVLVTNTSSVATSVSTVATLGPGSSAPLAAAISVLAWPTESTASCTASAVAPSTAYSATWASAAGLALTRTLGPGESSSLCVQTTMNVASESGIASGSAVDLAITTTASAGTWSSTATGGATQSFVDDLAPSAPSNLTASTAAGSAGAVELSWAAAADNVGVVGYDVYRNGTAAPIGSTSSTTFTDDGSTTDTEHTYSVVARDAVGLTSPAATVVLEPAAAGSAPSSPSPDPVTP